MFAAGLVLILKRKVMDSFYAAARAGLMQNDRSAETSKVYGPCLKGG